MATRIEQVTKLDWIEALCQTREFSEYMLYGYFVQNDIGAATRHIVVPHTPCVSYWDDPELSKHELIQLLQRASTDELEVFGFEVTGHTRSRIVKRPGVVL